MFTDEKLQQLHLDRGYKRSNCLLTNLKYSLYIVKSGNGFISLSMNTSPSVSLSVNLVKIFWFLAKYIFITKELVEFRKNVIEYILHDYHDIKLDIIKHSINNSYKWLEYNAEKLLVTKSVCMEYLSHVDNRLVLIQYSTQTREISEKTLIHTITLLDELFERAIKESKFQRLFSLSYDYLLTQNSNCELQNIISNALKSGNLTLKGMES